MLAAVICEYCAAKDAVEVNEVSLMCLVSHQQYTGSRLQQIT